MSSSIYLHGGRVVDPSSGEDEIRDLFVTDGRIAAPPSILPSDTERVDVAGLVIVPGLIDVHVHLRQPGGENAEVVATGARAAARGGFTTVVAMPNTTPPLDTPERVKQVLAWGAEAGATRVCTTACITVGRAGEQVADLQALADAGATAFSDDGCTVQSDEVMREAMVRACALGLPIMDHAQDRLIELQGGVMHEGPTSKRLGLPGIPSVAESRIVARDIALAEETGGRVHIQHVSSREGVALIREARRRGLPVSGEASPHHLALCDEDIDPGDSDYKMNPPLRGKADRTAVREGVRDGALEVMATDHAPHEAARKALGFLKAPFGIVGLETAVGVTYTELVVSGSMNLMTWLERWTCGPARVLGIRPPGLSPGHRADIAVLDVKRRWTVQPDVFLSRSGNTPFKGRELVGCALLTLVDGRVTWRDPSPA